MSSAWSATSASAMSGPSATVTEAKEGQIIAARNRCVASATGLGPPDLCYTSRTSTTGLMRSSTFVGQAHYCHGQETSSPAAIAAYFVELAKMWPGLHHGTYCCYNAFLKTDVRVEFVLPGSVRCFAITTSGKRRDTVSAMEWHEAEVSSMLRCMLLLQKQDRALLELGNGDDCAAASAVEPVVVMDPLAKPKREAAFLLSAFSVFGKGHMLGAPADVLPTRCVNLLTLTILDYYVSSGRPVQAEIFFSKFRPSHPDIAVLIARAAAQNPHGDRKRVLALLSASLQRASGPPAQAMLIEQSRLLHLGGNVEAALLIAEAAAVESTAHSVQVLLNMADLYVSNGRPAMALSTLNLLDHCVAAAPKKKWVDKGRTAIESGGRDGMLSPTMNLVKPGSSVSKGSSLVSGISFRPRTGSGGRQPEPVARTTPEHDEHAVQTGSLLSNPPVPEEDRAAFRTVVQCGRLLGRDGLLSVRNQLFAKVPSEPFVEAGVTIHARACSPWLDRLFLKLYADQITLAHWIGALAVNVHIRPIQPNIWSAAAALALRLEDVESAHKFLVRFRTDETYGDVAELALLKLHLQRKDLSRTIGLLSKLCRVQKKKAYEQIMLNHALFKVATRVVATWGTNATLQAVEDLGLHSSAGHAIINRAVRLVNPGAFPGGPPS